MNIEIISRFELLLTKVTEKYYCKMLPLNVLVHIGCLVASVATVRARPALFTGRVSYFNHLVLHNAVQVCSHKC